MVCENDLAMHCRGSLSRREMKDVLMLCPLHWTSCCCCFYLLFDDVGGGVFWLNLEKEHYFAESCLRASDLEKEAVRSMIGV